MKKTLASALAALSLLSFAESPEPVIPQQKDPNPYANYGEAMKPVAGLPMAVEWQPANADAIAEATSSDALAQVAESDESMAALLAKVGPAYKTDPLAATQIAALTQKAMCQKCPKAKDIRVRWTQALLDAAQKSTDSYATLFFLDQLRWCGCPSQSAAVLALGVESGDKAVADFAALVARELSAAAK